MEILMKSYKCLVVVAALLLYAVSVFAGGVIPDMKFRRLDTGDGLSSSQVNCIFKDSRGSVWIGTAYGLNRYDGYRVKTFYSNRRDTTTMPDNYVEQVYEGHNGKLWIKHAMHYSLYDPATERFQRNIQDELVRMGFPRQGIDRFYIDKNNNYWAKLYDVGIYCYNPTTKKMTHFPFGYNYENNEIPPQFNVSSFGTQGSYVIMTSNNGELICLDGSSGRIVWHSNYIHEHGGPENSPYNLYVDALENLWVIAEPYCFVYIQKEKKWYNTALDYMHSCGIEGLPQELQVWDLLVDRNGWLWMATDHEGLIVIDIKTHEMRQFLNNKYNETTISDNTLRHLYEDDLGQVWIGFYRNGVCQYRESANHFRTVELGEINTVCEDRYGNYWVGTNDQGIKVYNPRTGEVLQHYTKDNSGLSGNVMVGSLAAADGTIWFGSYNGGLVHCVPTEQASDGHAIIHNIRATDGMTGLANNNVWDLAEDHWHRIWIATLGSGVQRYDPSTNTFRSWNQSNTELTNGYMTNFYWSRKGWLMVGHDDFYSIINPSTGQLINRKIPEDPDLTSLSHTTNYIFQDSRNLIWQGSSSGVYIYNPKSKRVQLLDMTKGLLGSSVCSILEDKRDHSMWVVTEHGVSRIIVQMREDGLCDFNVLSFNSRDGLQTGTYNQRSMIQTRDGHILIGGQGGLDIIDPVLVDSKKSSERPIFSGLLIRGREVRVGEEIHGRVVLEESLETNPHLHLRYNENNFTIQLGSSYATVGYSHSFAYRLDGFDEDDQWSETTSQNPNISYMSLDPGSYTLRVRMLGSDGSMGVIESQLHIRVSPPFYRSWWAYLIYLLLLGGAIWWWRKNFIRRQDKQMETEAFRRETEKQQWMNEMRRQMQMQQQMEQPVKKEDIHLDKKAGNIVDFIRQQTEQFVVPEGKTANVNFSTTKEFVLMSFDTAQLGKAFQLLMHNSVRFCPTTCNLQVSVFSQSVDHVQVLVADNGVGIRDEYKPYVFEHKMFNGEELGLDYVKAVVEAHDGIISVEDNPGGGTVFVLSFPTGEEEIAEAEVIENE